VFFPSLWPRPSAQVDLRNSSVLHFSLATPHLPKSARANPLVFFTSLWQHPICPVGPCPILYCFSILSGFAPSTQVGPRQSSTVLHFSLSTPICPSRSAPILYCSSLLSGHAHPRKSGRATTILPSRELSHGWDSALEWGVDRCTALLKNIAKCFLTACTVQKRKGGVQILVRRGTSSYMTKQF
jgi:hypothetical protein